MTFLPAENITYTTTLKKDDLLSRLAEYVEPVKSNRYFNIFATNTTKSYKGKIVGSGFNVSRIIQYVFVDLLWFDWFCMCHKADKSNLSSINKLIK